MSVRGETSAPPLALARWAARVRVGEGEIRVVAARGVAREDGKSMSSWTAAVVGLGSSASSSARGARAGLGLAPRLSRSRLAADAAWAMRRLGDRVASPGAGAGGSASSGARATRAGERASSETRAPRRGDAPARVAIPPERRRRPPLARAPEGA